MKPQVTLNKKKRCFPSGPLFIVFHSIHSLYKMFGFVKSMYMNISYTLLRISINYSVSCPSLPLLLVPFFLPNIYLFYSWVIIKYIHKDTRQREIPQVKQYWSFFNIIELIVCQAENKNQEILKK